MTTAQCLHLGRTLVCRFLPCMLIIFYLLIDPAFAAEETSAWRSTYDEVMRWVNFAIFVLVIVKYARKPLADFLNGRKEEVAEEIEQVDSQKRQAEEAVEKVAAQLDQSSRRLEEIKSRIVNQGENRKAQIIAEAQAESEIMLTASKGKIKGQIANARHRLRAEMIDKAIDLALKRLPQEITASDSANMVNNYLKQALPE